MRSRAFLTVFSLAAACSKGNSLHEGGALPFSISGCLALDRGDTCRPPPSGRLTLAVAASDSKELVVALDARTLPISNERTDGDEVLFDLVVDRGGLLTIRAKPDGRTARVTIRSDAQPRIDDLERLRKSDPQAAKTLARDLATSEVPRERALGLAAIARTALAAGDVTTARSTFERSIALADAEGFVSRSVDDRLALAFTMIERSNAFAEARAVLASIQPGTYGEALPRLWYYRGVLERTTFDHRRANRSFERAGARARLLGLTKLGQDADVARALEQDALGRSDEAVSVLEQIVAEATRKSDRSPCDRPRSYNNLGFILSRTTTRLGDAEVALARALATWNEDECVDPLLKRTILVNRGLIHARRGELQRLRATLAEIAATSPTKTKLRERLELLRLDAEAALLGGDAAGALTIVDSAIRVAEDAAIYEEASSAHELRARAFLAKRDTGAAVTAYEESERALERAGNLVPIGEGRASYLASRGLTSERLADLLLAKRDVCGAGHALVRAWSRVSRGLIVQHTRDALDDESRTRWERALGAFQAGREALEAEAKSDWELSSSSLSGRAAARLHRKRELERSFEEALSDTASRFPLDPSVDGAVVAREIGGQIRYLICTNGRGAIGSLESLGLPRPIRLFEDPRSLGSDNGATASAARAGFAVKTPLGWLAPPSPPARLPLRVVIVGDPERNLPGARRESEELAKNFTSGPFLVDMLLGERATRAALLGAIERADILFFAGHGEAGGSDGWEGALRGADGRVTLADILAAPRVPSRVILTSCKTGATTGLGVGLSHAFIARGAELVVAPVRDVDDQGGGRIGLALARAVAGEPAVSMDSLTRTLAVSRDASASYRFFAR